VDDLYALIDDLGATIADSLPLSLLALALAVLIMVRGAFWGYYLGVSAYWSMVGFGDVVDRLQSDRERAALQSGKLVDFVWTTVEPFLTFHVMLVLSSAMAADRGIPARIFGFGGTLTVAGFVFSGLGICACWIPLQPGARLRALSAANRLQF
jgi:hypothetical protein